MDGNVIFLFVETLSGSLLSYHATMMQTQIVIMDIITSFIFKGTLISSSLGQELLKLSNKFDT